MGFLFGPRRQDCTRVSPSSPPRDIHRHSRLSRMRMLQCPRDRFHPVNPNRCAPHRSFHLRKEFACAQLGAAGGCGPFFPFQLLAWLYPCELDGTTCHVAGLPTFPLILNNTVQLGHIACATIPLAFLPLLARYVPGHTAALTDGPSRFRCEVASVHTWSQFLFSPWA
jgi:hypothetical protein